MANYVILANFTDQGVASAADSPSRATAAAAALKKLGGKMKTTLWTVGPYDAVIVIEAPDDETVTAWALSICGQGNVRTTTMRAFDRTEMGAIFERLG